jgi:DNA-binding response OmpR family regulator
MNEPKHILIVGGDIGLRNALGRALASDGTFQVTEVADATDAMAQTQLRQQRLHAIIVQAAPADDDGSDLCGWLRHRGLRVPIIVLREAATEQDVVRALDAGANDYVIMPFRLAELKARLRAQIREHETSEDAVLAVGPYHFRPGARSLHEPAENRHIRLTQQEVIILTHLYRAAGRPISRQNLLHEAWSYGAGARTHTVETHIYRLRRKTEPDPSRPYIILKDRSGYRLGQHDGSDMASSTQPPLELALLDGTTPLRRQGQIPG